jgi:hypothetical protein
MHFQAAGLLLAKWADLVAGSLPKDAWGRLDLEASWAVQIGQDVKGRDVSAHSLKRAADLALRRAKQLV